MMDCVYCGGKIENGTAPFHVDRKGYHLTFDEVSAQVCSQCGEVYFGEAEVNAIQEAIVAVDKQIEKIALAA